MRLTAQRCLLLALVPLVACGRPTGEKSDTTLDTVEVTAKPDAKATLETDVVAAPHPDATGVAGVLPSDFPKDVPLPEPSSLVDFGPHSVTVEVQTGRAAAKSAYLARLKARGFVPAGDGSWQKGALRIGVDFADASGATRIKVEIR